MQLKYSREILRDLENIKHLYSESYGLSTEATKLVKEILDTCKYLSTFPQMGRSFSEKYSTLTDIRFLKCNTYLIFYTTTDSTIEILRVLDGRSDYLRSLIHDDSLRDTLEH